MTRTKTTFPVGTTKHTLPMSNLDMIKKLDDLISGDVASMDKNIPALVPIVRSIVQMRDDEHPLIITTDRPFAQALALLYSELPIPSMMNIYAEGIKLRQPDSKVRVQTILGKTGAGKTFTSLSLANICDTRGAEVVRCYKGMDLNELLWETVLDTGEDTKRAFDVLSERVEKGTLQGASKSILQGLGDANSGNTLRWDLIGFKDGEKTQEQWDKDIQTLRLLVQSEGLEQNGNFLFTLRKKEGVLIRAAREGREVIVDEYEKTQAGTEVALYGLMQVLNGEEPLFSTNGGPGQNFTFVRDALPQGFFVTLTGNLSQDGRASRLLNDSEAARIQPRVIEEITPEDMQQRIEQVMTGMPVSTWYYTRPQQWADHPDAFTKFLHKTRMTARGGHAPQHEMSLLHNWSNVMQASSMLTQFHTAVALLMNGEWLSKQPGLAALADEISPELRKNIGAGDLRFVARDIRDALQFIPKQVGPNSGPDIDVDSLFIAPSAMPSISQEALEENYGTRLMQITYNRIMKAVGEHRPHLKAYIDKIAEITGIKELTFEEAQKHPDHKSLSDYLNVSPAALQTPSEQANRIRDLLVQHLKANDSSLKGTDEEILPIALVETLMSTVISAQRTTGTYLTTVPNLDSSTATTMPFLHVLVQDSVPFPNDKSATFTSPDLLLKLDSLLVGLAMPSVRDNLLESFSSDAFSSSPKHAQTTATEVVEGYNDRFMLTTLCCRTEKGGISNKIDLHLFHNKATDQVILIGDHIDPAQVQQLKRNGVIYIDRNHGDSEIKVMQAIERSLNGSPNKDEDIELLKQSFALRNKVSNPSTSLAQLLTDTSASTTRYPVQLSTLTEEVLTSDARFKDFKQLLDRHIVTPRM